MENAEHHHHHRHQAATRLSLSPPPPPAPRSAPLSPDSAAAEEALANSRWTPTKEQIGVLEGLYLQGMRTPTAEQIQQVTARLREHGPIEGKNVFYWFQNHKARQRQREKQQTFDYFTSQFQRPQPLPMLHRAPGHPFPFPGAVSPPPSQMMALQAAACNNREALYRHQLQQHQLQQQGYVTTGQAAAHAAYYSQTQLPSHYPRDNVQAQQQAPPGAMYYQRHPAPTSNAGTQQQPRALHYPPSTGGGYAAAAGARRVQPQTLNLFPLHPTFAQREKKKTQRPGTAGSTVPSASASYSWESEISETHNGESSAPFIDFFGLASGGH